MTSPTPAPTADTDSEQDFYTDRQLRERWQCSHMKLVRLRASGKLRGTFKVGGTGMNLTPASDVRALEVPSTQNIQLTEVKAANANGEVEVA